MKKEWNIITVIASIFIIIGLGLLVKNLFLQATGIATEGMVINNKKKKNTSSKPSTTYTYYPEVTFNLENGESRTVSISRQSSNRRMSFNVGDKIPLIYPKDNYEAVQINSPIWNYGGPSIFVLVGMIGWFLSKYDFENAA